MIKALLRYLFPPPDIRTKLPLLSLEWSSHQGKRPMTEREQVLARLLMGYGLARTEADAIRLMEKYPGQGIKYIKAQEQRIRRRSNKWLRAWERFKRLW